jgi:hypothetical protein
MMDFSGGESNIPARWASGGGGVVERRHYIEGELTTPLVIDEAGTIDVGGGELIEVMGNWFSAETGERVGAVWWKDGAAWVAIVKRCPVDETGEDPGTADGGDETGGGDTIDGGDETGGGEVGELDGGPP